MANISDVKVTIRAYGCGKQVLKYVEAVSTDSPYGICTSCRVDENGDSMLIEGIAQGKWNYTNNINHLFNSRDKMKSWVCDERMIVATKAYDELMKTLRDNPKAYMILTFIEAEPNLDFMGKGYVRIAYDMGEDEVRVDCDYDDLGEVTTENLIRYGLATDEQDAKEYLGYE